MIRNKEPTTTKRQVIYSVQVTSKDVISLEKIYLYVYDSKIEYNFKNKCFISIIDQHHFFTRYDSYDLRNQIVNEHIF